MRRAKEKHTSWMSDPVTVRKQTIGSPEEKAHKQTDAPLFLFGLMVFSGAVATIRQRIFMYLIVALTVLEFTADLIVEFSPSVGHWGRDTALNVASLAILVVMTLRHTFRPGPASVHRVMGGVAAYLLIGLTWAFGYKLLLQERPDAIHFQSSFAGTPTGLAAIPTGEPSPLIYFSFATLTSVSYGDAYPRHRIARSWRWQKHSSDNSIPRS